METEPTKSNTGDEPIQINLINYSRKVSVVLLAQEYATIDGVLHITVHIGEPGQNLRIVKDDESVKNSFEDIAVDNRPGA